MKTTLFATFAIVSALALVGAIAAESIVVSQQAHAGLFFFPHHGCKVPSNGFFHSHFKCFHPG
jgi:hypothetical protein